MLTFGSVHPRTEYKRLPEVLAEVQVESDFGCPRGPQLHNLSTWSLEYQKQVHAFGDPFEANQTMIPEPMVDD